MTVGELYMPGKTKWREFVEYLFTDQGHELRIFFSQPRQAEIVSVNEGDWQFAFYERGGLLWFLYSGPFVDWSDCPFTYHLVPAFRRALPSLMVERAELRLNLVDANTGILAATRRFMLSPHFTNLWHRAILRQAEGCPLPFDLRTYEYEVRRWGSQVTPRQMYEQAAAKTRGGGLVLPGPGLLRFS